MREEKRYNGDPTIKIREILGNEVVDDMIDNPEQWSNSVVFSDERFKKIEGQVQKISATRHTIYNQLTAGKITEAEADKKITQLENKEKRVKENANYPVWQAFNELVGLHTDLMTE